MKFQSIFATAFLAVATAQTLEEIWNLEEPSFEYANKNFAMTFQFSEGIVNTAQTKADLFLYQDLNNPDADTNCYQAEAANQNGYTGSALTISENDFTLSGEAVYERKQEETVNIGLDTDIVSADASIFTDNGDGSNLIAFCVRYGLYTGAGGYEVNFLETLVELTVDLRGDFNVTGISVAPKDKLQRTANIEYGLVAFQCTGKDANGAGIENTNPGTFNQGDVITVCVEPDDIAQGDSVYMRQVERFEYVLLEEDGVTESNTRQLAIDVDNPAAGTRGAMFGLTNIDNCLGEIACKIETILFATFYARPGTVTGLGSATMQFGTIGSDGDFTQRKLRGAERSLQADDAAAAGEFDVNFDIASNDAFDQNSGAASNMAILSLLASAVTAMMLQ
eukprot:scaffold871_cov130-Cylindrotheca_fusiformis.AAC.17